MLYPPTFLLDHESHSLMCLTIKTELCVCRGLSSLLRFRRDPDALPPGTWHYFFSYKPSGCFSVIRQAGCPSHGWTLRILSCNSGSEMINPLLRLSYHRHMRVLTLAAISRQIEHCSIATLEPEFLIHSYGIAIFIRVEIYGHAFTICPLEWPPNQRSGCSSTSIPG